MDIVKMITQKIQEIESTGKLEQIIEKHVISCLDEVVKDSFTWNGSAKKALEKAIEGKLNVNLENIKLDQYQKITSKIVEDRLNETLIKDLKLNIEEVISKTTSILERKEYKLSEVISKFIEDIDTSFDGGMDDLYGECSLHIEKSSHGDYFHIYFDKETDKRKYGCSNSIHLKNGKIYHGTVDEKPFSPFLPINTNGFETFLFQLYCNNVSITIDEEDCELEYYREDHV